MHPSSVPILHLSGSPREQGHQHGEALRASIAEVREQWRASITTRFKVHPDAFIDALVGETRFVDAMRRWAPSLLDEVEGIAEGSGRPLAETLAFQFMDEEWWFGTVRFLKPAATAQANHCSIIATRGSGEHPPLLAQNMDLRAYYDGGQAMISVARPHSPRAMVMTICGMIGLCGANDAGLGVAVNTLWQLRSAADGLPVACVMREILDRPNLAAAREWMHTPRHASGQHYLIGDPDGFASFEASAAAVNELPWAQSSPAFVHTNHPLALNSKRRVNPAEDNSRGRYDRLCGIIADKLLMPPEVKAALADRSGDPPISVRPDPGDPTSTMTFASIVMELRQPPRIELASGPPCSNAFQEIRF
jgi:isopenicillin-N N-acyltransferase-like protein